MTTMQKFLIAWNILAIGYTILFMATIGGPVFAIFLGFHIGLLVWGVSDWITDRTIRREIMEEINSLSRNYDNQMSMNFGENNND